MNFSRIGKLSDLLTNELKRKPTIILDPNPEQPYRIYGTVNNIVVGIDVDSWVIPEELKPFVADVAKSDINMEEKILQIYQKLCEDYTYDDNTLTYIKKNDDDSFFLPDEYGREIDGAWKANRQKHNRRNCFEISRILAKSIDEIVKNSGCSRNYDICIIWDEINTHYFVGLASKEYYVSLDLDDFTQMKDITRQKTGLTLEGIKVLEDESGKFETVLEKFNENRPKSAKNSMEERLNQNDDENSESSIEDTDDIEFLQYVVQVLKEDYNLDSAGIYEYLKEIVDTRMGPRFRKKVWKEVVETDSGTGKRFTRCLIVTIGGIPYIIDVTKDDSDEIFHQLDAEEPIIPFKDMKRNWKDDPYDGR